MVKAIDFAETFKTSIGYDSFRWHIVQQQEQAKWGDAVVEQLSADLRAAFPDRKDHGSGDQKTDSHESRRQYIDSLAHNSPARNSPARNSPAQNSLAQNSLARKTAARNSPACLSPNTASDRLAFFQTCFGDGESSLVA